MRSECINGIRSGRGANIGFEAFTIYNIDGFIEEPGDVVLEIHVIENRDAGVRINLDHNIDVATEPVVAASHRANQGGVRYPPTAQGLFGAS